MELIQLSKSEQDYIKEIYKLQHGDRERMAGFKQLSSNLGHAAATVTGMVKRLEKKDLVCYESYKGVQLTELGFYEARFILKSHRVWETFLIQKIGYQLEEVHEEAEILEHSASPKLIERLYAFLGYPEKCPHGTLIPSEVFWALEQKNIELADAELGTRGETVAISDGVQEYLTKLTILELPKFVTVVERLEDGTCILRTDGNERIVVPALFQKEWQLLIYK